MLRSASCRDPGVGAAQFTALRPTENPGSVETRLMEARRLAYSVGETALLSGLSRWSVMQAVERGEIRSKRIGRRLLLDPADVERLFGFAEEELEPSSESIVELRDFLA